MLHIISLFKKLHKFYQKRKLLQTIFGFLVLIRSNKTIRILYLIIKYTIFIIGSIVTWLATLITDPIAAIDAVIQLILGWIAIIIELIKNIKKKISNKLGKNKIRKCFMPNLIPLLDASNIHLIILKLTNIPLYIIHDCFATTVNNMELLDLLVKSTFIEIYFGDINLLKNMHPQLIKQITDNLHNENINLGRGFCKENNSRKSVILYQKKSIIKFKNKNFMPLYPILKILDKLLVPLVFTDYIKKHIQLNKFIYSRVPNYSLVKLFLNLELEKNIMIAKPDFDKGKVYKNYSLDSIILNENNTLLSGNFSNPYAVLDNSFNKTRLLKNTSWPAQSALILTKYKNINQSTDNNFQYGERYSGCYIIIFNNLAEKNCFYIGSSIQLANRISQHKRDFNNFKGSILNSKSNLWKNNKLIEYKISYLYLNTNYFKKFKKMYPFYILNKGEWILLKRIDGAKRH